MVKRRARISFARRDGWVLAINPQEESMSMARLQGKAFATMPQRQGYDEARPNLCFCHQADEVVQI
jgi:hypothetical protein